MTTLDRDTMIKLVEAARRRVELCQEHTRIAKERKARKTDLTYYEGRQGEAEHWLDRLQTMLRECT